MFFLKTFALAAVIKLSCLGQAAPALGATNLAPLYNDHHDPIQGSYIVQFHDGHDLEDHLAYLGMTETDLRNVVNRFYRTYYPPGFIGEFSDSHLDWIRRDPAVKHVSQDHFIEHVNPGFEADFDPALDYDTAEPIHELRARDEPTSWVKASQPNPPWHLSAICAAKKGDSQGPYQHLLNAGEGVNIYIMDSGVGINHSEFGGRAVNFHDRENSEYLDGNPSVDDVAPRGHGTAVASLAAGKTFGVATHAKIVNVKITELKNRPIGTSWYTAMEAIIKEHASNVRDARKGNRPDFKGSIINMSFELGSTYNQVYMDQLSQAEAWGIALVVAAPNRNKEDNKLNIDEHGSYPCNYGRSVLTCVGSIGRAWDVRTEVYGTNITMFAPGYDITAADLSNPKGTSRSGNSMAAPIVSGVLATFMGYEKFADKQAGRAAVGSMITNAFLGVIPNNPGKPFGGLNVVNNGVLTHSDKTHPFGGITGLQQPDQHDELKI